MTDQTSAAPHEPEDPQERIIARLDRLIAGVETGSAAVAAETTAREHALNEERQARAASTRQTRWLLALVGGVLLLAVVTLAVVGWDRVTRNETTCTEKLARSAVADQRVLIGVNRVAEYAELSETERAELAAQVQDGFDELPPPC